MVPATILANVHSPMGMCDKFFFYFIIFLLTLLIMITVAHFRRGFVRTVNLPIRTRVTMLINWSKWEVIINSSLRSSY